MTNETRVWGNYKLERRIEFGHAARRNRGHFTGQKIHRLRTEYIVEVIDEAAERAIVTYNTLGHRFLRDRKPVLFTVYPCCGVTSGQFAGIPVSGYTQASVTCTRCK